MTPVYWQTAYDPPDRPRPGDVIPSPWGWVVVQDCEEAYHFTPAPGSGLWVLRIRPALWRRLRDWLRCRKDGVLTWTT